MSIFLRVWLAIAGVLVAGGWFTVQLLQEEVKPSVRQAIEETLADNANLVAVLVADDVLHGRVQELAFDSKIHDWLGRHLGASIWDIRKTGITQQLYITDSQGVVIYDSEGVANGQDFSRWNDVWLTLRGKYGVRSSRKQADDPSSSVMYVAAPVMDGTRIIGVVTLGKPGVAVQPFIERARDRMLVQGLWIVAVALVLSALLAWWFRASIRRVGDYALSSGRQPLHFRMGLELNQLVASIDRMREELEGKAYVERLAQTLTHELKSPLTAIRASAEILRDELPPKDRLRFSGNIETQAERLQHLADQMLMLARLEQGRRQRASQAVDLYDCIQEVMAAREAECRNGQFLIDIQAEPGAGVIVGDRFWLVQAIGNVVDNALAFMPRSGGLVMALARDASAVTLTVRNDGPQVPEYAVPQVFDRFYSLPSPEARRKGTGIGLTLVREVMEQHGGTAALENIAGGVEVTLRFPA